MTREHVHRKSAPKLYQKKRKEPTNLKHLTPKITKDIFIQMTIDDLAKEVKSSSRKNRIGAMNIAAMYDEEI